MKLNKTKVLKTIIIVSILFILIYIFHDKISELRHILRSPREIKRFILSYGAYSAIIFVLIYSLKPIFMVIPSSLFSILAGNIFGPFYGLLLNITGGFFSSTIGFFLANKLGKSFVDSHLKGKALQLDDKIEEHGFKLMLVMRLAVVFPHDALSFAAGLSKMKYKDFILASVLGTIPEMICYSVIGQSFGSPFSMEIFIPIIGAVAIAIVAYQYYKTVKNK